MTMMVNNRVQQQQLGFYPSARQGAVIGLTSIDSLTDEPKAPRCPEAVVSRVSRGLGSTPVGVFLDPEKKPMLVTGEHLSYLKAAKEAKQKAMATGDAFVAQTASMAYEQQKLALSVNADFMDVSSLDTPVYLEGVAKEPERAQWALVQQAPSSFLPSIATLASAPVSSWFDGFNGPNNGGHLNKDGLLLSDTRLVSMASSLASQLANQLQTQFQGQSKDALNNAVEVTVSLSMEDDDTEVTKSRQSRLGEAPSFPASSAWQGKNQLFSLPPQTEDAFNQTDRPFTWLLDA
jgi:hypothetical protein